MTNKSAYQRMLETIEKDRDMIENPSAYQQAISEILGKIPSPKDRIEAISITMQSNLNALNRCIDEYVELMNEKAHELKTIITSDGPGNTQSKANSI